MTMLQAATLATAQLHDEGVTCPECGSKLEVVVDGEVGTLIAPGYFTVGVDRLEYTMVQKPFAACTGCEFCMEIKR